MRGLEGAADHSQAVPHASEHASTMRAPEEDMEVGYEDKSRPLPTFRSLEELEQHFLQQTMELTRAQRVEEEAEEQRHREVRPG